jgi:outer membrane protein TolC
MRASLLLTPVLLAFALWSTSAAQPQEAIPLSLDSAVTLALQYHPSVQGSEAFIRSSAAEHRAALAGYFPSINVSASGTHTEGTFVFNPSIAPRDQIYSNYTATLQMNQTLWDFGRTSNRVGAGSSLLDASMADDRFTRDNVITNVRLAYYTHMQAKQVVGVTEEAYRSAQEHLKQVEAFYSVGRRPQFDVTKAEVDVANANVAAITARNQARVTRLQLENAIGLRFRGPIIVADTFEVRPFDQSLDSLETGALSARPDIRAAELRVEASDELAGAATSQHFPILAATGTYTWSNFKTWPLYNRWVAGVTLSLPLFQGFALVAAEQQAEANADVARSDFRTVMENARLDVEQNYLTVHEALERISASVKLVESSEQSYLLAERQYAAGVASAIEVSDAQLTLSNARITRIQALFDYNSAYARLLRAIGRTQP